MYGPSGAGGLFYMHSMTASLLSFPAALLLVPPHVQLSDTHVCGEQHHRHKTASVMQDELLDFGFCLLMLLPAHHGVVSPSMIQHNSWNGVNLAEQHRSL